MTIDAEWAMAVLRVIQATNIVMVYTPAASACCFVRDLDISSLQSQLALTEGSLAEVTNEMATADGDSGERRIDVDRFIWSVLHVHNASFCPRCGCELCLPNIEETKWATCLALVRTHADVPICLAPILNSGACWASIHSHEFPVYSIESAMGCLSQTSSITPNLLLTTLTRDSRVDLHVLHELITQRARKLSVQSTFGVLEKERMD